MAGLQGNADRRAPGQDRITTNRMVTIVSGHGNGVVNADTVNLGPGGMFLATTADFAVGDRFICRIDLGEPYKPVLSGAEVRWIDDDREYRGVGVRFLDIAQAAEAFSGEIPTHGLETVRVRLASVGSSLQASVVERTSQTMVVELELPFLEPGTQVEVGPDVAARTATVRSAKWVGEKPPPMRIQLELDLEPASVEIAAERVKAESTRSLEPEQKRRFWQLPAKIHRKRKATAEATEEARSAPVGPATEHTDVHPVMQEEREPVAARTASSEVAEPEPEAAKREVETATEKTEDTTIQEARTAPAEDTPDEAGEVDRKLGTTQPEAALTCDEDDEELVVGAFNPLRGPLERILGAAVVTRLFEAAIKVRAWIGERVNGPRLAAVGRWCLDAGVATGGAVLARLRPVATRAWDLVRVVKQLRRSRKQSRGEPSSVVRQLTDRARRVAARRGRTIALIFILSLGVAGLATAGYGLVQSSTAEEDRESVHQEAERAGWTTGHWAEPDPVEPSSS